MNWLFYINTTADLVIVMGFVSLAIAMRHIDGGEPPSFRRSFSALRLGYWAFVLGASTEIGVAAVEFLRSFGPMGVDGEEWASTQYLLAAGVGVLAWSALRRYDSPATETKERVDASLGPDR